MRELPVVAGDGTTLYLEEHGDPDAPVTVVLTHGWALDRRTWRAQIAGLLRAAGRPVRILAYDHRGHGRSDPAPPGTATIGQLGDDLAEVLTRHATAGRVVLAGHSMGGMTIMALAERHRSLFTDRVAGVAFVSTSGGHLSRNGVGGVDPPRWLTARIAAGGNRPPGRALAGVARRWLGRSLFGPGAGPVPVALTAEIIASHWPATLLAFRPTFDDHERHAALAACAGMPVAVLCGEADRLCPPSHSRRIADRVPAADLVLLPGAGHMLTLERSGEVTGRLAALVRATDAAAV
ncbi:MAG TPA: alpha/beta fold hydrolase [Mycobacteriales bacterium]|nr:alpha/beta fold hydrolase [Mycobacteriales bacterium]